jgi:hypothetical protein
MGNTGATPQERRALRWAVEERKKEERHSQHPQAKRTDPASSSDDEVITRMTSSAGSGAAGRPDGPGAEAAPRGGIGRFAGTRWRGKNTARSTPQKKKKK